MRSNPISGIGATTSSAEKLIWSQPKIKLQIRSSVLLGMKVNIARHAVGGSNDAGRIIIPTSAWAGYTYAVVERNLSPLTQFCAFPSKPYNGRPQVPLLQSLHYLGGLPCYAH